MSELKAYLDQKEEEYNQPMFIKNDPISIPHQFSLKQDIEIAGFLTAIVSWGNRTAILKSAQNMMDLMENNPWDFVLNFNEQDLEKIRDKAIHRTFNGGDFIFFLQSLQRIYRTHQSLEDLFLLKPGESNFYHAIERFRTKFLEENPQHRSKKHLSSPYKNASAKRFIMFLRWMVRQDQHGVDFGLWQHISPKFLSIPLDVHTGNVARTLGMISRKQNDWKTVEQLDRVVRLFDSEDPAKYDFALFGIGVYKDLK